jgi:Domain of unknown function (DUF4136)
MKDLVIVFIFAVFAISCTTSRYITDHDYSYDNNLKQIQSFDFVKCKNDSTEACSIIQETIIKQMEIRGYKYDPKNAEMYIGFTLLPSKTMYKAYKQPNLMNWFKKYNTDETYKTEKYNFYNGMIMLSMIEAKSNVLVWRGFTSNLSKSKKAISNMDAFYNSAICHIFDEYPLMASNNYFMAR